VTDKILVFCPMRVTAPRAFGRSVTSVLQLEHDNPVEYMLRDGKTPHDHDHDNVTAQYNWARQHVLQNSYTHLLAIEADIIAPKDTITKLLACRADIAYGLYSFRRGKIEWCAHSELKPFYGKSISEDTDLAVKSWGKVVDVVGAGMGCTMITREALANLGPFESGGTYPNVVDCDWRMALKAQQLGLTQRADLSVICGHIALKPSLRIFWPIKDKPFIRIEKLEPDYVELPDGRRQYVIGGFTKEIAYADDQPKE